METYGRFPNGRCRNRKDHRYHSDKRGKTLLSLPQEKSSPDGFLKVYRESFPDEDPENETAESNLLPPMETGQQLERKEIQALQRFTQHPPRYNEASLVKKLKNWASDVLPLTRRPSAPYSNANTWPKGDKEGEEKELVILTLKGNCISQQDKQTVIGAERANWSQQTWGTVVNDFLCNISPKSWITTSRPRWKRSLMTSQKEKTEWTQMMKDFYGDFEPEVEKTLNAKSEHKVGERLLGTDPQSGKPVFVKIGRFGPVVQIGTAEDEEKPRFAQMKNEQSLETITLEEALELFKLPATRHFRRHDRIHRYRRFGPYVLHNKKYVSLPKGNDPMSVTLQEAIKLILENGRPKWNGI